jgi:hypothetical protein
MAHVLYRNMREAYVSENTTFSKKKKKTDFDGLMAQMGI